MHGGMIKHTSAAEFRWQIGLAAVVRCVRRRPVSAALSGALESPPSPAFISNTYQVGSRLCILVARVGDHPGIVFELILHRGNDWVYLRPEAHPSMNSDLVVQKCRHSCDQGL